MSIIFICLKYLSFKKSIRPKGFILISILFIPDFGISCLYLIVNTIYEIDNDFHLNDYPKLCRIEG